jgi:F-type H+-transporting ATPase subunit b
LALANSEANASKENARREINSQKESALNQLKSDADKLGDLIVKRLLAAK